MPCRKGAQCGTESGNDGFISGHEVNPALEKCAREPREGLKTRQGVDHDVGVYLLQKCLIGLQKRLGDASPTSLETESDEGPDDPEVLRDRGQPPIHAAAYRSQSQ